MGIARCSAPMTLTVINEATTKENTKESIKSLEKQLKHEKKKLECIEKLEALGFDLKILKEVLM